MGISSGSWSTIAGALWPPEVRTPEAFRGVRSVASERGWRVVMLKLLVRPWARSCTGFIIICGVGLSGGAVAAQASEIVHAPVASSFYQRSIEIAASSRCADGQACSQALYFRSTPPDEGLTIVGGEQWTRVQMRETGRTPVPGSGFSTVDWAAQVPAAAVSTTGVDYWLENVEGAAVSRLPAIKHFHVHTLSPPIVVHAPPGFGRSGTAVPVELDATCSTRNCEATVWYRTSPESGGDGGASFADWPSQTMDVTAVADAAELGKRMSFRAVIPAEVVNTRGVDYVFRVSDQTARRRRGLLGRRIRDTRRWTVTVWCITTCTCSSGHRSRTRR